MVEYTSTGAVPKLKDQVITIVSWIPSGTVVSYGQVALIAGMPRAARQVGWLLGHMAETVNIPWWRVINNSGRISIKNSDFTLLDQKVRLENEGIKVSNDCTLNIEKYRFRPNKSFYKRFQLPTTYITYLITRYQL
ncbi:MAG: Protein containing Methylated-DNA-[protein]-cysteine S-methyltransferase [candidate division WWE3 bacterium GW2011_GWC2_44_9]|uniref:Protein containing Methylated-DNA-[protein]-cysteine S-methyltransferase n=1 Tax=candidate division WWE3 bacterium GW2011_GWC2_44_9 TaxID=1619125 RepID=A0A0G1KMB0_UNCKA|nr:MAG: Protein containing Methylated-DNA-[protein]-cysteine S-methyltransferase [candidate division WWE3 bacterium GW2011_GWC2_44_9]